MLGDNGPKNKFFRRHFIKPYLSLCFSQINKFFNLFFRPTQDKPFQLSVELILDSTVSETRNSILFYFNSQINIFWILANEGLYQVLNYTFKIIFFEYVSHFMCPFREQTEYNKKKGKQMCLYHDKIYQCMTNTQVLIRIHIDSAHKSWSKYTTYNKVGKVNKRNVT